MSTVLRVCALLLATANADNANFYLFSREYPDGLTAGVPRHLQNIPSDSQIRVVVHGWSENRTTAWYDPLTKALLAQGPKVRVLQVDYSKVSSKGYLPAVRESVKVGEEVGSLVVNLTQRGVPLENIEIIGHSLGGQVAGYAGAYVFNTIGKKVPRITALDPAGPLFQGLFNLNSKSLSKSDADLVVVLHTDRNLFGYAVSCGTIDIFPNGGEGVQPGCPEENDNFFCSHHRSYWFYIDALTYPKSLVGVRCKDYKSFLYGDCDNERRIDLGGVMTKEDKGRYYMVTSATRPFKSIHYNII